MTETYQHCIFVCSNYTTRTRTGLHFLFNEINYEIVKSLVQRYTSKEGVAFYFVNTINDPSIESVKKKDNFFKNIQILEGTTQENVVAFNNAINNQITVNDVALLLLCRKRLTVEELKTSLFYIYCLYAKEYDKFPFKEKLFFDKDDTIGFKLINNEFSKIDPKDYLECTKPDVIMSKFFNCDGGVELMNDILKIFYKFKDKDFNLLKLKIDHYYERCCKVFRKKEGKEPRYTFAMRKKTINKLKIDVNY